MSTKISSKRIYGILIQHGENIPTHTAEVNAFYIDTLTKLIYKTDNGTVWNLFESGGDSGDYNDYTTAGLVYPEDLSSKADKLTTPTPIDQLSSLRIDENGQYQTSNNFYVKDNIEFNQVLQLEGFDIINIFLTDNLSFEFDSILNISARRINIYNDVKINIDSDITFNFLNSENTSIRVFSHITTFGDRTITILGLYNNIFNNFYFNGVNCDTALSNGQLTFVANDYIAPYKSIININSLHNIDLVYSTTNVTLNIIDWDRNTTDKIKILRKVSESLYYSNNTRMFAVLETGKLYQYISEGSTYTIDNINVLATKHGGNTRFVALETVQQNAEILTITDANVSTYVGTGVGALTDMIINVPINTKIISIETTTKQKVNGVQFDHQPANGKRITITGNIEYATGEGYNSTVGRFSQYLYSYLTSSAGSGATSSVHAFYDFLYWNGIMYTEGY